MSASKICWGETVRGELPAIPFILYTAFVTLQDRYNITYAIHIETET